MAIKNLQKAALRLRQAIKKQERVILYGDTDMDGVTSVIILEEALKNLGANIVDVYFPDREKEGYGITPTALQKLKKHVPAILLVSDLGISNFKEIEEARKLGFFVMLVDHHEVLGKLPKANIIVNPRQKAETYAFREFAACGLALRLAQKLLGPRASQSVLKGLVELAALGTIADIMPREKDNVEIIEQGMKDFHKTWRPGLKAFFETGILVPSDVPGNIGSLIAMLNVRDESHRLPGAYRLLTSTNSQDARELARVLQEKSEVRRRNIREIAETIHNRVKDRSAPLLLDGGSSFEYVLLGAAASILAKEFQKPIFLYKKKGEECLGSVRSPHGYDTVKAMKSCAKLLITYGGHPVASGFRLKTENLKKFEQCLAEYFKKHHA
ncbi:MAG: hypothetical protein A3B24_00370 [Candidatus Wildermuthbacteria bacterium RIFCSPLOWO2_01_FULL_48_16]|uniref:Single-stranded-DNA-specific exonuclease RecJ n=1 Tax=Candidatus Wildermuthbacteria bacterium RIFCSPLOWO2_01_FULL_48_16 TaxID=1802461 RepID=A0A1G2RLA6_9BACT|nr:MAG: hypothetical protein A3J57_01390 [Candidatus Wildermuthbacteria bacterium RIFCSPHIGHO2_02_FULL_49_12b]OHA73630.1 MAG: hypothetical protein A3B24_00370 [Candidatus Wildermuthbacteria bacterium RIFCSPLOWO2_01_FULL_48_16]